MKLADALAPLGVELEPDRRETVDAYLRLVLEKNRVLNLTAAGSVDELVRRHVADALACLPWLRRRFPAAPRIIDVGCGAGFLGVALVIAWPQARLTLLDSSRKRTKFLEWVLPKLGLQAQVLSARAESAPRGSFDAVLERALAPLPEAIPVCLPLAAPGGAFLAWRSASGPLDPAAQEALAEAGGRLTGDIPYRLQGEKKDRRILVMER